MHPTRNDLPLATRKKVISQLAPLLADAIDLYTQVKQAHWNVRGANFIALHELFDTIAGEVNDAGDLIAERILQLGGVAEGTARVAAKRSRLKEYPLEISDAEDHVESLAAAIASFNAHARDAIDSTDRAGDAVTADMCTEIARGLDKQLWFVEAHVAEPSAKKNKKAA